MEEDASAARGAAQPSQPVQPASPAPSDSVDNSWLSTFDEIAEASPTGPAVVQAQPAPTPAPEPASEPKKKSSTDTQRLRWMDKLEEEASGSTPALPHDTIEDRKRAGGVQLNLLGKIPEGSWLRIRPRFQPCSDVSGDFYEFINLPDGRIGFALGDVSGHGMEAGLIMSMAKKTLAIFARSGAEPIEVLSEVNDALAEDLHGRMFITLTYAILDPSARSIVWTRAGHNPTLLYNVYEKEWQEIKPPGMVVGMKAGAIFRNSLKQETVSLRTGDVFVMYTDGITETMNMQRIVRLDESGQVVSTDHDAQEEYGVERMQLVVEKFIDKGVEPTLDAILDSVRQFRGGGDLQDDLTLMALRVD